MVKPDKTINHKFAPLVLAAAFLLFSSCSDMISRLDEAESGGIGVRIACFDSPVENIELGLVEKLTLSIMLVDEKTGEQIIDYSMLKSIDWTYPDDTQYISAANNNDKLNLFLTAGDKITPADYSYTVSLTVNGKQSPPCTVSIGEFYTASDAKELGEVIDKLKDINSGVNTLKIKGDVLVSNENSFHTISKHLENETPLNDSNKTYTLDLSEATTLDLTITFEEPPDNKKFWEYYSNSSITKVILPEDLEVIGKNAFCGYEGLTSIDIPNSVTTIETGAFEMSGLTSVTIPASVTEIGASAFYLCTDLQKVTFEGSNITIGANAFSNYNLTEDKITFAKGMSGINIGPGAFDGIFSSGS